MAESVVSQRPKLARLSEEMRRISVLLAQEVLCWPEVSVRSMFGLRAFYRGTVVFAMLPDKRALESGKAIAYKLPAGTRRQEGAKWRLFELENERDIGTALARLENAYREAAEPDRK